MKPHSLKDHIEVIADPGGGSVVHIPTELLWECIECFGANRMNATYTFSSPDFVARVIGVSPRNVAQALRNWKEPSHDGEWAPQEMAPAVAKR
jgi:hypothetical protein